MGSLSLNSLLLDTHALLFWQTQEHISSQFIRFLDEKNEHSKLLVSSVSFWELALLQKKKRIDLPQIQEWKALLLEKTKIKILDPSSDEMIASVLLPEHHKDPFDRLLIAQTLSKKITLVSKDSEIKKYSIETLWMD